MLLSPEQYAQTSVLELLREAARGRIPLDQRWLRAILDRGESCAQDLLAFLREDHSPYALDLQEDIVSIARHLASPAMLPVLVELAERCLEDWPDELEEAFRIVGAPAVEPLLRLRSKLADPFALNDLLATLGVRDPRILEALVEELEEDPVLGSLALGIYGDPAGKPYLEKALGRVASELERREIREIIERLDQPSELEPPEPFDIWSRYPEEADPAFAILPVEDLIAMLDSPVVSWRLGAANDLGLRGQRASEAKDRLYELACTDPDPEVRGACWRTLIMTGSDQPWREQILGRLGDPAVPLSERRLILLGLAGRDDDPLIRRWILDFYDDRETRAVAMEAMRLTGDPGFARFMIENFEDPDPGIRRQAVLGVGTFGMRGELHRLSKLFSSPLRQEALSSYAVLVPMEPSRSGAHRALRRIEEAAGGLSPEEASLVTDVLDDRLVAAGRAAVFSAYEEEDYPEDDLEDLPEGTGPIRVQKVGRNEPCPCGSGKKYKKCCGA